MIGKDIGKIFKGSSGLMGKDRSKKKRKTHHQIQFHKAVLG
jgi:hypothetical protein